MSGFFGLNKVLFVFWGTFLCSIFTYGQYIEGNSKTSVQGQVEIVMSNELSSRLDSKHKLTDRIFSIAQNTTFEIV